MTEEVRENSASKNAAGSGDDLFSLAAFDLALRERMGFTKDHLLEAVRAQQVFLLAEASVTSKPFSRARASRVMGAALRELVIVRGLLAVAVLHNCAHTLPEDVRKDLMSLVEARSL